MKSTDVPLAVILLMAGMLVVGGSCITKVKTETVFHASNIITQEVFTKEEKAAPAPQPVYLRKVLPKAAKSEKVIPRIDTINVKVDKAPYYEPERMEDASDSIISCNLTTEAEYPGGPAAWQRFLLKNMRYPEDAIEVEIQSSVSVQFVVDEEGNVSAVEAINGTGALAAEAVRVIKKSGRWIPGRQLKDGRSVRSIKRQPFIICIEEEE